MPTNTTKLNLLKMNPSTDGAKTFNIDTMLNENWDKVDAAVGKVQEDMKNINPVLPDGTLTQKGIVQLSNATSGTRENVAATEKAVGDVQANVAAHLAESASEFYRLGAEDLRLKAMNIGVQREVANLNLQLEASKRVPSGITLGSNFSDSFGITIDTTKTVTSAAISVGSTSITVESVTGLTAGMEVTIYDDVNIERVKITSISGNTLTVPALTKVYKAKASVARTSAVIDVVNKCAKFGGWSTIVTNTVTDAAVVKGSGTQATGGNGGRRIVRLSNGWMVAVVYNNTNKTYDFYVSKNNGMSWANLCYCTAGTAVDTFAIVSYGTMVFFNFYMLYATVVYGNSFDATTIVSTTNLYVTKWTVDSGQNDIGTGSLAINEAGTELHAAWSSKNSTYPNTFNIRYAKGTIKADGSVAWGAAQQVTNLLSINTDVGHTEPSIIIYKDNNPIIVTSCLSESLTYSVSALVFNGSSWTTQSIYTSASTPQVNPQAIYVPPSINRLSNGQIWVTWKNKKDNKINTIQVSSSIDRAEGWDRTQMSSEKYDSNTPTVTVDKNNNIYVLYSGYDEIDVFDDIRLRKRTSSGTWDPESIISNGTTGRKILPNTMIDFSLDISSPLFIYHDAQASKVGFYGTWKTQGEAAILENDIRFTLKDTNEAVTWVQHDAGLNVTAALNAQTMDKTTVGNEDQFVKSLAASGPAEIRLSIKRFSTSNDVRVNKILGGVG